MGPPPEDNPRRGRLRRRRRIQGVSKTHGGAKPVPHRSPPSPRRRFSVWGIAFREKPPRPQRRIQTGISPLPLGADPRFAPTSGPTILPDPFSSRPLGRATWDRLKEKMYEEVERPPSGGELAPTNSGQNYIVKTPKKALGSMPAHIKKQWPSAANSGASDALWFFFIPTMTKPATTYRSGRPRPKTRPRNRPVAPKAGLAPAPANRWAKVGGVNPS